MCRAFHVVAPLSEGLEDGKYLLVVDLVVKLNRLHAMAVECDWVDFTIVREDLGDDCCNCISEAGKNEFYDPTEM